MSDAITTWLEHTAAGTLDTHLWRHPGELIQMHRLVVADAEANSVANISRLSEGIFRVYFAESQSRRRLWRDWDLSHISPAHRLYVVSLLHEAILDQSQFNFLTATDLEANYGVHRPDGEDWFSLPGESFTLDEFGERVRDAFHINAEDRRLAEGFARQMIDEAAPHQTQVALGAFDMARVPLQYIDSLILYDSLRLIIRPDGIAASYVGTIDGETRYQPLWWSPGGHTCWLLGGREAFAIDVMMACIWRDACIVRHQMFHERSRAPMRTAAAAYDKPQHKRSKLLLPRTVKQCAWALDSERDQIIRSRHSVRAFFRTLPEGHQASEAALRQARHYGYPLPPDGFTFVRPHQRGSGEDEGDAPLSTPVVCTGLQTAAIALNWRA